MGARIVVAVTLVVLGGQTVAQVSPRPCAHGLRPADADEGAFGMSVDYRGDRVIVGEPQWGSGSNSILPGSASVFVERRHGWALEQRLAAASPTLRDEFGDSVAIEGSLAVVGAPGRDDPTRGPSTGAVYVFERSGSTWSEVAFLLPATVTGGGRFGGSVSLEGGRVFASARESSPEAAYVFERQAGVWVETQMLTGNTALHEDFGVDVDASGDRVVVGANSARGTIPSERPGAAYVFALQGSQWARTHKLIAAEARNGDGVGWAVAIDGDSVIVGAPWFSSCAPCELASGRAIAFLLQPGNAYVQEATWQPTDPEVLDMFGWSIDVAGRRAHVYQRVYGNGYRTVHTFERSASGVWTQIAERRRHDFVFPTPVGFFADVLCAHGDRLVFGDPTSGAADGRAYVVELPVEQRLYCSGKTNSLGCVPFLDTCGNPRSTGVRSFHVGAEDLIPGQPGVLIYGFGRRRTAFHGGTHCVKLPFARWLPAALASSEGANPSCPGRFEVDFSERIRSGVDPRLSVGQRVFTQVWQRDPLNPAGFGDSLTNALSFVIQP